MNFYILKTNAGTSDLVSEEFSGSTLSDETIDETTDAVDVQTSQTVSDTDTHAADTQSTQTVVISESATDRAEDSLSDILTETEAVTQTATEKDTSPAGLGNTLPIMAKGMLGIFLVTAAIILTVALLNKVTNKKDK